MKMIHCANVSSALAPEVYAARQIVAFAGDGQTGVARAQVDAEGDYRVELPPGTYVVSRAVLQWECAAVTTS